MAQEDDSRSQVDKALEVLGVVLVAHNQSAEVKKPSEESLNLPAPNVAAQRPSILSRSTLGSVRRNHFGAIILHQGLIQPITVIGLVPNQALGDIRHDSFFECRFHQLHFSWRSTFCPQGERKTMAVCNAHDLGALAPLGLPNQAPLFLAGTNVPSTKHSLRSNSPASLRCCARVSRIFSMTPERTQFWKRRCAVWYGPYRGGKSCQGAPVRKIHNTPFSTLRRSLHGRPRPSSRTGSSGRMASTTFH